MANPTLGWIGLGNAGFPMAANLGKAGYHMIVRDADSSREEKFVKEYPQCKAAVSDEKGFQDCDIVVTMLPNGKVVQDVLIGVKGIAQNLRSGTVVIDLSSSSPFDTRELGAELKKLSIDLVDSPITQEALHAIDQAGATLMVGSDSQTALDKALPVLRQMSRHLFVMGGLGSGHVMKTLNNYVSVGSILALCDALVSGQKLGLDPQTMIDVLNVGTGRNFSTAYSMKESGLTKTYDSGYQLELLIKDVKIAKETIANASFDSKLPDLAIEYLQDAMDNNCKPGADHTECLKGWERRAGIELKKSEPRKDTANGTI